MIQAIGTALNAIQRGTQKLDRSHQKIANGNLDPEPVVEGLSAKREIEAQFATIKTADQLTGTALDLLA